MFSHLSSEQYFNDRCGSYQSSCSTFGVLLVLSSTTSAIFYHEMSSCSLAQLVSTEKLPIPSGSGITTCSLHRLSPRCSSTLCSFFPCLVTTDLPCSFFPHILKVRYCWWNSETYMLSLSTSCIDGSCRLTRGCDRHTAACTAPHSQILPTNFSNPASHPLKSSQSPQSTSLIQTANLSNLNHQCYADCMPCSIQPRSLYADYMPRSIQPPFNPLHQPLKTINQPLKSLSQK